MSDSYRPREILEERRVETAETFEALARADERLLISRLADHGIDLNRWREMLEHPRAFQALLEAAEQQRPMVSFSEFVRDRWSHGHYLRSLLQRYSDRLFGQRDGTERDYGIVHALGAILAELVPVPTRLDGEVFAANNAEANSVKRVNPVDTVPLVLLDTPDPLSGVRELKERFLDPAYRTDWDDGPYLMQYTSAANHRVSVPGARLVRFGLFPIGPDFETLEQVTIHLAEMGAKPAGTEAAFALAAYPKLASWFALHPEGGTRREDHFKLWLPMLEHSPDLPADSFFTLEVQYDVYRRPWVRAPRVREFSSGRRENEDYVPFIIPVQHWSPDELLKLVKFR